MREQETVPAELSVERRKEIGLLLGMVALTSRAWTGDDGRHFSKLLTEAVAELLVIVDVQREAIPQGMPLRDAIELMGEAAIEATQAFLERHNLP